MKTIAIGALALAACLSNSVTPDPTGDYTQWGQPIVATDDLPGHGGATYRKIYANDVARTYEGGAYPDGTVLVKEVYDRQLVNGVAAPGALQYVAIMRRLGPPPAGFSDEGGWLFTYTTKPQGSETHYSYCWESCHQAAPFGGAWLDYSK
jgi:hypothetical protein